MLTLSRPLRPEEATIAVSIDQTMRAKLPSLPHPIVASWDEGHRLVISRGEPWIVGPLETDPYVTKEGGYPFPVGVAAQLQRIAANGARFHRIAIAHEVDPKGSVGPFLAKVTPRGIPLSHKTVRDCLGEAPAAEKPKNLAGSMDKVIRKTVGGIAGVATAVGSLAATPMLDPIVFGVIGVTGAPVPDGPAIYYPLAAWVW